jgi:hypothetical protein
LRCLICTPVTASAARAGFKRHAADGPFPGHVPRIALHEPVRLTGLLRPVLASHDVLAQDARTRDLANRTQPAGLRQGELTHGQSAGEQRGRRRTQSLETLLGDEGNTTSFQAPDRVRTYLVKDVRPEHIHVDRHYSQTATESTIE